MTKPSADDLRGMTAGRELDALVAYHLFGWRWYRDERRGRYSFQPPTAPKMDDDQIGVWTQSPWGPGMYSQPAEHWPAEDERFIDWHRSGMRCRKYAQFESGVPAYSTDPAASAELRRHLVADRRWQEIQVRLYRDSVVLSLVPDPQTEPATFVEHTEPVTGDPVAAECAAWAKAAVLSVLAEAGQDART